MKLKSTFLLKGAVIVIGLIVLALCVIILRQMIIDRDIGGGYLPILIGLQITAIPFFIGLYQAWKLLRYIDTGTAFSDLTVRALKNIKYCASVIGLMFGAGLPYIFHVAEMDDAPGVVLIGLIVTFASIIIAVFAALLERLVHSAIEIKSENDLTV